MIPLVADFDRQLTLRREISPRQEFVVVCAAFIVSRNSVCAIARADADGVVGDLCLGVAVRGEG
jgi:hypothetical protein